MNLPALLLLTALTQAAGDAGLQPLRTPLQGAGCAVRDDDGRLMLTLDFRSRPNHRTGVAAIRIAGVEYRLDWDAPEASGSTVTVWRFHRPDGAVQASLHLGEVIAPEPGSAPAAGQEGEIRQGVLQVQRAGNHDDPIEVQVHCGA